MGAKVVFMCPCLFVWMITMLLGIEYTGAHKNDPAARG
jgi:hypothetical protein